MPCSQKSLKMGEDLAHTSGIPMMVATERFLTGADAIDVRCVIFAESARCLIKPRHAAGRAGCNERDEKNYCLFS